MLPKTMTLSPFVLLAFAAVCNIASMICLKLCAGFTRPWPSLGVAVLILITQWLIGAALVRGGNFGLAITGVIVTTMVGAAIVGPAFSDPKPTFLQCVGYALAVAGVIMVGIAK